MGFGLLDIFFLNEKWTLDASVCTDLSQPCDMDKEGHLIIYSTNNL